MAFKKAKEIVASDTVFVHFDPQLVLRLLLTPYHMVWV